MLDVRKFYAVLEDWRHRPYDWKHANCCHFAADVVRCSGRGRGRLDIKVPAVDNVEDAVAWLRLHGYKSLYQYLLTSFGKPVAPLQARRGAIAYRKGIGLEGSAIGAIDRKALFVGDNGLIELPLSACSCAFEPNKQRNVYRG